MRGSGFVTAQRPAAGQPLEPGGTCALSLRGASAGAGRGAGARRGRGGQLRGAGTRLSSLLERAGVHPLADPGADPEIRGASLDSRRVGPGDLFFAVRGLKLDGESFVPDAIRRGARAVVSAAPRPEWLDAGIAWVQVAKPRRRRAALARVLRATRRGADPRRHHRHERQDHRRLPGRVDRHRRRAGRPARIGTVGLRLRRGRAAADADDPRGTGPLPAAGRDAGRVDRPGGDGGLVARPGPAPGRGRAVRHGGVPQPQPRPSGLSRGRGELTSQPRPACSRRSTDPRGRGASRRLALSASGCAQQHARPAC